ncbi:MAG TPA: glycosyltransferase family 4 protein [Patescibacteria group bacterium]|nr:glycosyltransferase family 4 protein [Patescibacteria group bacterium]
MRIGIYDPYLDDLGGGEKYMMTIAEVLSHKHEVSVFWDNKDDFDGLVQRFGLDMDRVKLTKNIFAAGFNFFDRLQVSKTYDVIIVLSDGSVPIVASKKMFLHIQQPLSYLSWLSWKERLKAARVTGIFYNSEFTKIYNEKLFSGIRSSVIYPPVVLHAKDVIKENVILHVGRFRVKNVAGIDDYKKQSVMIEAFKKMVDSGLVGDWKFVLAVSIKEADKDTFAKLQQFAEGYPIEFLINKTNDELWETYNKAKIYWHASGFGEDIEAHPEFAEHFGISTVEAMGAGAVPVVFNAGGQKEIVTEKKNGLLWNTLEELEVKTKLLIDDERFLLQLSEHAKQRAQDFSKDMFSSEILHLIEKE